MATPLNRSVDKIFQNLINSPSGTVRRRTNPRGANFGFTPEVARQGSAIQAVLDSSLDRLRNRAANTSLRSRNMLEDFQSVVDEETNRTPSYSIAGAGVPTLPDGRPVPNSDTFQTAEEAQQFVQSVFNDPKWLRDSRTIFAETLGAVGDIASRPIYALNEGARNALQALDEGQEPWEALDDQLIGMGRGLWGTRKTTPGDLAEYATSNDVERNRTTLGSVFANSPTINPMAPLLNLNRELEEAVPGNPGTDLANRAMGFGGEILGDPLNWVGGKAVTTAARQGAKKSTRVTDDVLREVLPEYADDALQALPENHVVRLHRVADNPGKIEKGTPTHNVARDIGDDLADALERGSLTPNNATASINNQVVIDNVRQELITGTVDSLSRSFRKNVDSLKNGKFTIGSRRYNQYVDNYDDWKEFDRVLKDELDIAKIDDVATRSADDIAAATEVAEQAGREFFTPQAVEYANEFERVLRGNMYNTLAVRFGELEYPMRWIGKINKAVPGRAPATLSYKTQLPAYTGEVVRKSRAVGHQAFEDMTSRVREIANKFSKNERRELSRLRHAYGDDIPASLPDKMKEGLELLRDEYDDILYREKGSGVVPVGTERVRNYQYAASRRNLRNYKSNQKALQEGKAARREELANPDSVMGAGWHQTSPLDIKKQGGKDIIDDPFEALAHRRLKSERLVSRSLVSDGFFNHYGVTGRMSNDAARQRGLVKVYDAKTGRAGNGFKVNDANEEMLEFAFSKNLKELAAQEGNLYLPESVADAYKSYVAMADFGRTDELGRILTAYDKALNFFKLTATVPYPGFHIKNMIGDIYLGYLDGVKGIDYTQYTRQYRSKDGLKFGEDIAMPQSEFNALFQRNAGSAGFVENEYFAPTRSGGPGIRGRGRQLKEGALELSENREDLARKVHFWKAINEELADGKNWDKAVDNAAYRVNKWKFDYGALTLAEKKYMRRMIPFYTFMRKSAPAMLEGLITHPSIYGKTHRFFDSDTPALAPQWIRDIGFASPFAGTGVPFVGDDDNPLVVPQSVIPIDTFDNILGGASFDDPGNILPEMLRSQAGSLAPLLKSAGELAYNRNAFTGSELNIENPAQFVDYLAQNFAPPYSQGRRELDRYTGEDARGFDLGEFLFGSRFAAGVGARRLDDERQLSALDSAKGKVSEELARISQNIEPYGIKVFLSETSRDTSIKVRELGSRRNLYVGDLDGALEFVDAYTANPANLRSEGEEIVRYVDNQGRRRTGPANSPDLVRVIDD